MQQYWAKEIKKKGSLEVAQEISRFLYAEKIDELYVSFDIDAIDEYYASATGTPEPEGLSPEDAIIVIRELASQFALTGADLVEVAPFLNTESDKDGLGRKRTLETATQISQQLLEWMNLGIK